jgi:transposase
MKQLEELSLAALRSQLDSVDGKTPTQRVLAAIGRKLGASTEELAELHNVSERTVRNWLRRFQKRPIEQAPYDDSRSGRPPKLSDEDKAEFFADLRLSPEAFGFDQEIWAPSLAHQHLESEYNVEYSLTHIRRLMNEAGLSLHNTWSDDSPAKRELDGEFTE